VSNISAGKVQLAGKKKHPARNWDATDASKVLENENISPAMLSSTWRRGISVTAQSGDSCKLGSWVFFDNSVQMNFSNWFHNF
jgi:hypothetical protein